MWEIRFLKSHQNSLKKGGVGEGEGEGEGDGGGDDDDDYDCGGTYINQLTNSM